MRSGYDFLENLVTEMSLCPTRESSGHRRKLLAWRVSVLTATVSLDPDRMWDSLGLRRSCFLSNGGRNYRQDRPTALSEDLLKGAMFH